MKGLTLRKCFLFLLMEGRLFSLSMYQAARFVTSSFGSQKMPNESYGSMCNLKRCHLDTIIDTILDIHIVPIVGLTKLKEVQIIMYIIYLHREKILIINKQ